MDWPALSPDLNPIENLWGIIARQVYGQGKHDSKVSLTGAIMKSLSEIDDQTVKSDRVAEKSLHRSDCSERRKNKVLNDGICDFI